MNELVSIAVDTARCLATEFASPYVSYFFHFGENVEELQVQRHQLELKKRRVQKDVDEATRQTMLIEEDVQKWLKNAENELREARGLEDEVERSKCFNWCPNWGWRCCLSKKVVKKTSLISELLGTSFAQVGRPAPLEGIEFLISKDFMPSKSSKEAFDRIMKALTSDGVNVIGLHGMPGVGKTTLAEEVGKQAKEKKFFDEVVFLTVSQTPDFNKIQNEIGERLGLDIKNDSQKIKAEKLWRRLIGETRLLIIFDDIWKRYSDDDGDIWDQWKMKHIGIPFGGEHRGCKFLLTTRSELVCRQMDCQERIQLNLLSEDEAWTLFKVNARLENPSSPLIDVAKEVARECQCLPLAIITVARALKGETLTEWKVVNQRFKESRHLENQEVCGGIYRSLKISYDYLKENNYRLCLQLCSLFAEDYAIEIKELTVSGFGRGMFDNVDSIEAARGEMSVITTKLQECGLLLKTGDVSTVKMHDVVRDFVHWITSKEENAFLARSGLKEWPRRVSFGCCKAISLINCEINNFPDKLEFPKLEVFWLDVKSGGLEFKKGRLDLKRETRVRVPSTFFGRMKALKVLFLREVILSLEGLQFLPNFRTLRLKSCDLENVSWLEKLEKLEILIINSCSIKELCYELRGLTTLKLLDLSGLYPSKVSIPPNSLQSLFQLEELCLDWRAEWAMNEENAKKASLSELLTHLTRLSLIVRSEFIPKRFVFPPLQRYYISVFVEDFFGPQGTLLRVVTDFVGQRCRQRNVLRLSVKKCSLDAYKNLFCNVEVLELNNIMDLEYLSEVATAQNLNELKIEQCRQLQVIFQMDGDFPRANEEIQTPLVASLTSLHLVSLPELQSIWKGPTHRVSLQNLKVVMVYSCNKLTSLFSLSLAQTLLHLEKLKIGSCGELKHIINTEPGMDDHGIVSSTLPHPRTHHVSFGNLKVVMVDSCNKLTSLFSLSLAQTFLHLEELEIRSCGELKHIISTEPGMDDHGIVSDMLPHPLIRWPKFKTLKIRSCTQLEYVFPITLAQDLQHLECIEIADSPQLRQVFGNMAEESDNGQDIPLPRLQRLSLEDLPNLSSVSPRNYFVMSPSLKNFEVGNCPKLTDFPVRLDALQSQSKDKIYHLEKLNITNCLNLASLCPMGQNLKKVVIKSCDQLREIFQVDEDIHSREANQAPLMSNLTWLDLRLLSELRCIWKGSTHHVSLSNLKVVRVSDCNKLTSVFSPSLAQTLVHLEELRIQSCHGLERVFDSAIINLENITAQSCVQLQGPSHSVINLRSLKTVNISNCNRLRCLFPASLVKSLVQLEKLFLNDLPELAQLITELESDLEQEQQVSNMVKEKVDEQHNNLLLLMLPSLKGFEVSRCPRLTPFVIQQEVNNQAQVKGLHLSNRQCNSLDILSRQSLPNLEHGIVGNHLQFLQWLIMSNCSELKYLFSPMLAQSLPHLRTLSISQCKDLEQIVDKDKPSASSSQGHFQPICFLSLTEIYIEECNNLKSLFSVSVALSLSQLWVFEIKGASKLEHVFEYQDEIGIDDIEKEIVLPRLGRLSLEMLPRLKSFIPIGYHCSFPHLGLLDVKECPNLTTSFSKVSEHTIHARTKAAGDAPMDGSAIDVDATEVSNTNDETAWPVGSDIEWSGPGFSRDSWEFDRNSHFIRQF